MFQTSGNANVSKRCPQQDCSNFLQRDWSPRITLSFHTFLSITGRLPVCGRVTCRPFHFAPSVAHSYLISHSSFISTDIVLGFHFNLGPPLGRFPSIFISDVFCFLSSSHVLKSFQLSPSCNITISSMKSEVFASSGMFLFL